MGCMRHEVDWIELRIGHPVVGPMNPMKPRLRELRRENPT